jgi:2-dehydro-3-deoxyphosphogalactonate aldolase
LIDLDQALAALPLVAILRGIRPDEAEAVGRVLIETGFRLIEVPLNSPDPLTSIRILSDAFGGEALIGAGTVLSAEAAGEVVAAGGRLIVMPHGDTDVIRAGKDAGAWVLPGVATPTEGFAALGAGADALKMFPGEALGPPVLKAWRAVFPANVRFIPVGGVTPETMPEWWSAGAAGFGVGSALYKPGLAPSEVRARADLFLRAWRSLSV